MTATMPGVSSTLHDTFSALEISSQVHTHRVAIVARTGADPSATYAHDYDPKKYTSLADVGTVHGTDSELYEAFYHAQYSGCDDIWLCPISNEVEIDRTTELETAYESLFTIRPSIIVPYGRGAKISIDSAGTVTRTVPTFGDSPRVTDGAYADSTYDYLDGLADICAEITESERLCIGILGIEALSDITATGLAAEFGESGTLYDAIPDVSALTTPSNGKYVAVVAAEVETAGMAPWAWRNGSTTTYYRSNGALNYAGLISRLALPDAPTNKIVTGISNIAYRLSRAQTLLCVTNKLVTFNVLNGIVRVDDAMTYAEDNSDYQRQSTVLIVGQVDDMIRAIGRRYIGKGMNQSVRDSFVTSVASGLDILTKSGVIIQADFNVRFDGPNSVAYVDVVVVPAWELRRIELSVRVTFQGINSNAQ